MLNAIAAIVHPGGHIGYTEPFPELKGPTKVYVLFANPIQLLISDEALPGQLLSQSALAQDWLRAEEDAAWSHLQ
jgi:hypothetical protein